MTDEELISTLWSGEVTLSTVAAAAVRIKELMRNLKSVLEREAETQARHDTKMDALEAKLDKATDVLREILFFSNEDDVGGWLDAIARGQALMTELDGTK